MSVNSANTPDGTGVLLFNGEVILIYSQGVTMTFADYPDLNGKSNGTVYLTSHRIIFMPNFSNHWLKSFEMPFGCLRNVQLQQPIFGSNYLQGLVSPSPGSLLRGEVSWTISFTKGGCIDFGHALLDAVDRASSARPMNAPPSYVPPPGDYYAAPPVYYEPSEGFHGPNAFPDRPDPNNVFMMDAPPPYPGIGAEHAPHPTDELVTAGQTIEPTAEGLRRRR